MARRSVIVALAVVAVSVGAAGPAGAGSKSFVGCGASVSGHVTLLADLNCSGGGTDGLIVNADGTTINLNGHSIIGGGGGDGHNGIVVANYNSVTIENGTIANFTTGIIAAALQKLSIRNVNVVLDGDYGACDLTGIDLVFETSKTSVSTSTVSNTGDAFDGACASYGIVSGFGSQDTFDRNTVSGADYSFSDVVGTSDTWSNDTSTGVTGETTGFSDIRGVVGTPPLETSGAQQNEIPPRNIYVGDAASGGKDGFSFPEDGQGSVTLKGSTASDNSHDGGYMSGSVAALVSGNTFLGNGSQGMHGAYNKHMTFGNNVAAGNGFDQACTGGYSCGNGFNFYEPDWSVFTDNKAIDNYGDGFHISGWLGIVMTRNTAKDNNEDGFDIENNSTCGSPDAGRFASNRATGNSTWGAIADNSYIPGKGNTGSGNGSLFDNVNVSNAQPGC